MVILKGTIGFIQEAKVAATAAGLRQMALTVAKVIRGSKESQFE
jgi:hypothetical protein